MHKVISNSYNICVQVFVGHEFSPLLDKYQGVWLLDFMIWVCLLMWNIGKPSSEMIALFLNSYQKCVWVPVTPHPCQYLVVSVFVSTNPLGLSWYLSVFVCSSLIADDIEHFLLCLRIICTTSFAHFKTLFYFVLWLIYTDSLCVLIMISFSDM